MRGSFRSHEKRIVRSHIILSNIIIIELYIRKFESRIERKYKMMMMMMMMMTKTMMAMENYVIRDKTLTIMEVSVKGKR